MEETWPEGVLGALIGLLIMFLLWGVPALMRWRHRRYVAQLLASLAAVAMVHREVCRALMEEGRHTECPLCHVDTDLWKRVTSGKRGWMHVVRLAQHRSWLDWDVPVARIVMDQFSAIAKQPAKGDPA